jgi:hypothetical protein
MGDFGSLSWPISLDVFRDVRVELVAAPNLLVGRFLTLDVFAFALSLPPAGLLRFLIIVNWITSACFPSSLFAGLLSTLLPTLS